MSIKRLYVVLVTILVLLVLTGCKDQPGISEASEEYRFIALSDVYGYGMHETVMYDKYTSVMYIFYKNNNGGGLCPIYNPDGSLMIYQENSNVE